MKKKQKKKRKKTEKKRKTEKKEKKQIITNFNIDNCMAKADEHRYHIIQ